MNRTTKILLGVAAIAAVAYYIKRRTSDPVVTPAPGAAAAANSTTGIIGAVGDGVAKILGVFKGAS